ncbi:SseB family protein [Dactylosporangium sp. NPDC048998]|uniref:SseB family protein n=1 Tax=Dactylosporangium sp. NPDC048998 TaxID=3363976 RepID=UPI0037159D29
MSEWEPATEAEVAMRDALRTNDQEQYFRILARTDVLLPIAPDGSASSEGGWGTWTTEGRTHVLAFTSPSALHECLAGHPGTHRRVPFRDLAGIWPNVDWWLAVNPGLPIEGYLPSWFVTQISRGDVRLPGRTLGARARMEQASSRTRAVAQVPVRSVPNQPAPTPIERQRMKADQAGQAGRAGQGGPASGPFVAPVSSAPPGSSVPPSSAPPSSVPPRREVPPPDVAPPGAFLPTRADRPIHFERSAGRSAFAPTPPSSFAGGAPAVPPPAENGAPTSPAPTSGAGAARGRASFPGAASRGLFDESDRLDVPGERELFAGLDRGPAARTDLPTRPQNGAPSSGLPTRPVGGGDPGLPAHPARPMGGESGLPRRPAGGGDPGLPSRPVGGGEPGFPSRPVGGGESGLPSRPVGGGESGLPSRPVGGEAGGDAGGDPRRYWPRREPARSLGEIFTEHAEPVIPAAWQPPPDLPRPAGPPLPTRQPQPSRIEPEPPTAFRPGGQLPPRPGAEDPAAFRSGGPLPSRPASGEPVSYRPGESLPQRPGFEDPYRAGESRPVSGQPATYRAGESRPVSGEPVSYRPGESLPRRPGADDPYRPGGALPSRPDLVDPGAFRPAADERPALGDTMPPGESTQPIRSGWAGSAEVRPGSAGEAPVAEPGPAPFGDVAAGARSAGFGRAALDDHPFFADEPAAGASGPAAFEPRQEPSSQSWTAATSEPREEQASPSWTAMSEPREESPSWTATSEPRQEPTSQSWTAATSELREEQASPSWTAAMGEAREEPWTGAASGARQEPDGDSWPGAEAHRESGAEPWSAAGSAEVRQEGAAQPWQGGGAEPRQEAEPWQEQRSGPSTEASSLFSGRAEVQSSFFQDRAEPTRSSFGGEADAPRSFLGDQGEAPREDEQRPFFDDEPEARPFNAFADSRPDEPPIRDPYAALADLRSDPDPDDLAQPSFASGVESLAKTGLVEPRPEESQPTEPPASEARPAEPWSSEPWTSEPWSSEARASEPWASETGASEPWSSEAWSSEPWASEPRVSEPWASEARSSEPWASEPRASEPWANEARASEASASPQSSETRVGESWASEASSSESWASEARASEGSTPETQADESWASEADKENSGSFFLPKAAREAAPSGAEPSPELRSFFEEGAAERPDFQQDFADLPVAGGDPTPGASGSEAGFSWTYEGERAEPTTYHVDPVREPTHEPVYEPEVVEDARLRLHEEIVDAEVVAPVRPRPKPADSDFRPANTVEKDLLEAVQANSTDRFLSTLLLAKVLIPFWTGDGPVTPANWRTEHMNGLPHLVVFTSQERMTERLGADAQGSWIKFTRLIRHWPPGDQLAVAINPESPAGAVLPGTEVVQLATWATELGLGVDDPDEQPAPESSRPAPQAAPRPAYEPPGSGREQVMQKPISPEQLSHYLERNYDRVSGFVHRAGEVAHLQTPEQLYNALGLGYAGSSFKPDADEAYVLRWIAYRGDLYRIPYGGSSHDAMRAMEGWVIERPPFRGNGFAPSETGDVIAEFKVDSARLPHNAELWRVRRDGREDLIARLDADGPAWRKAGRS